MSAKNVEIIKQMYAVFLRRDAAAILELASPDIEIEQSAELAWGGSYRGHKGLQEFFAALRKHLENRGLPIDMYLDAGDHVVAIGRTHGVVRANGKPFDVALAHLWEIQGGKAIRFRPFIDHPTMQRSLK